MWLSLVDFDTDIGFKDPDLGSLHTRAKSRDHEIVRVQKKVF